jgi:hypothetical protein
MSRLVIESQGLSDWRSRLADPVKQWRRGFSAFEAAVAWECARDTDSGIPPTIIGLLNQRSEFADAKMIVGIVEHKVSLSFGKHPSQNDVWALVKVGKDLLSLAVEAKAGESFAELVSVWLKTKEKDSDKDSRLDYVLTKLGIPRKDVSDVRYQLLHRTASALIEADRVGARYAAMIIQSFNNPHRKSDPKAQLQDFRVFGEKLGATVEENRLVLVPNRKGIQLYLGWVTCEPATDPEVAKLA